MRQLYCCTCFMMLIVTMFPPTRIYGRHDIEPCICFPQHLLEEGHEGEVCQWHELLCLPFNYVPRHTHTVRYRYGRTPNVGCWLAKGSCRCWPQCSLVKNKINQAFYNFLLHLFFFVAKSMACRFFSQVKLCKV